MGWWCQTLLVQPLHRQGDDGVYCDDLFGVVASLLSSLPPSSGGDQLLGHGSRKMHNDYA